MRLPGLPRVRPSIPEGKGRCSKKVFLASKPADGNSDPANKVLVMATLIPLGLRYTAAKLSGLDIAKRTRWMKDVSSPKLA